MTRAAIFIDGGYLNKILKSQFNEAKIDYLKLSEKICASIGVERLRTYYYYCTPIIRNENRKNDEVKVANAQRFLDNLKRLPRFEVRLGRLQIIGGQFKQKMVDVLMSLDIVDKCFENQISHAILIAGDSDFIPAIEKAKNYGAIVHLFYHPTSVHNQLLDTVDELHSIDETFVKEILQ